MLAPCPCLLRPVGSVGLTGPSSRDAVAPRPGGVGPWGPVHARGVSGPKAGARKGARKAPEDAPRPLHWNRPSPEPVRRARWRLHRLSQGRTRQALRARARAQADARRRTLFQRRQRIARKAMRRARWAALKATLQRQARLLRQNAPRPSSPSAPQGERATKGAASGPPGPLRTLQGPLALRALPGPARNGSGGPLALRPRRRRRADGRPRPEGQEGPEGQGRGKAPRPSVPKATKATKGAVKAHGTFSRRRFTPEAYHGQRYRLPRYRRVWARQDKAIQRGNAAWRKALLTQRATVRAARKVRRAARATRRLQAGRARVALRTSPSPASSGPSGPSSPLGPKGKRGNRGPKGERGEGGASGSPRGERRGAALGRLPLRPSQGRLLGAPKGDGRSPGRRRFTTASEPLGPSERPGSQGGAGRDAQGRNGPEGRPRAPAPGALSAPASARREGGTYALSGAYRLAEGVARLHALRRKAHARLRRLLSLQAQLHPTWILDHHGPQPAGRAALSRAGRHPLPVPRPGGRPGDPRWERPYRPSLAPLAPLARRPEGRAGGEGREEANSAPWGEAEALTHPGSDPIGGSPLEVDATGRPHPATVASLLHQALTDLSGPEGVGGGPVAPGARPFEGPRVGGVLGDPLVPLTRPFAARFWDADRAAAVWRAQGAAAEARPKGQGRLPSGWVAVARRWGPQGVADALARHPVLKEAAIHRRGPRARTWPPVAHVLPAADQRAFLDEWAHSGLPGDAFVALRLGPLWGPLAAGGSDALGAHAHRAREAQGALARSTARLAVLEGRATEATGREGVRRAEGAPGLGVRKVSREGLEARLPRRMKAEATLSRFAPPSLHVPVAPSRARPPERRWLRPEPLVPWKKPRKVVVNWEGFTGVVPLCPSGPSGPEGEGPPSPLSPFGAEGGEGGEGGLPDAGSDSGRRHWGPVGVRMRPTADPRRAAKAYYTWDPTVRNKRARRDKAVRFVGYTPTLVAPWSRLPALGGNVYRPDTWRWRALPPLLRPSWGSPDGPPSPFGAEGGEGPEVPYSPEGEGREARRARGPKGEGSFTPEEVAVALRRQERRVRTLLASVDAALAEWTPRRAQVAGQAREVASLGAYALARAHALEARWASERRRGPAFLEGVEGPDGRVPWPSAPGGFTPSRRGVGSGPASKASNGPWSPPLTPTPGWRLLPEVSAVTAPRRERANDVQRAVAPNTLGRTPMPDAVALQAPGGLGPALGEHALQTGEAFALTLPRPGAREGPVWTEDRPAWAYTFPYGPEAYGPGKVAFPYGLARARQDVLTAAVWRRRKALHPSRPSGPSSPSSPSGPTRTRAPKGERGEGPFGPGATASPTGGP